MKILKEHSLITYLFPQCLPKTSLSDIFQWWSIAVWPQILLVYFVGVSPLLFRVFFLRGVFFLSYHQHLKINVTRCYWHILTYDLVSDSRLEPGTSILFSWRLGRGFIRCTSCRVVLILSHKIYHISKPFTFFCIAKKNIWMITFTFQPSDHHQSLSMGSIHSPDATLPDRHLQSYRNFCHQWSSMFPLLWASPSTESQISLHQKIMKYTLHIITQRYLRIQGD